MEDLRLDKRQIVREALLLLRDDGIDKLSMRKLAARLDIRAPTLYWYFPDRSSILREVIKTLLLETFARIPECASCEEWLRSFGASIWQTNCETPYVTLLLQSAELNDEGVVRVATGGAEQIARHFGTDYPEFLRAYSNIKAFVLGWSVFHHSHVTKILDPVFDSDDAVRQGVDDIIANWSRRAAAGTALPADQQAVT